MIDPLEAGRSKIRERKKAEDERQKAASERHFQNRRKARLYYDTVIEHASAYVVRAGYQLVQTEDGDICLCLPDASPRSGAFENADSWKYVGLGDKKYIRTLLKISFWEGKVDYKDQSTEGGEQAKKSGVEFDREHNETPLDQTLRVIGEFCEYYQDKLADHLLRVEKQAQHDRALKEQPASRASQEKPASRKMYDKMEWEKRRDHDDFAFGMVLWFAAVIFVLLAVLY